METIAANSPAKINLTLHVCGRQPNGYHDLESLVAQISLCDTVTATRHEDGCYALECDDPALPRDGSNLVLQAAKALNKAAGTNHGAEITLTKRIPAGAGLGGGSSNAATILKLLNGLWDTRLPSAELAEIGAALGSDVPLFFHGPLCVIRGRGERAEPLAPLPAYWVALVLPPLHCATPAVYKAWDQLAEHANHPSLTEVLAAGHAVDAFMDSLFNDLEAAAFRVLPELGALQRQIQEATGLAVRLTGSGAAMFRLFDEPRAAAQFALRAGMECGVRVDVVSLRAPSQP